jgi:hypothetical protein
MLEQRTHPTIRHWGFPFTEMVLIAAIVLSGCTSVPLTTLYKLHKIDPMEADPAQIKVAIRADERIGIGEGGAKIEVKFEAEDGSLNIDETYLIEIIRNPGMSAELFTGKNPGESVTVLGLTQSDIRRMRAVQSSIAPHQDGDLEGTGSLGVYLDGVCLNGKMPAGQVLVDVFLQTSDQDGFFVFARNLDLRKESNRDGTDLDDWPDCLEALKQEQHT